MKLRSTFVSNSSSASFVVEVNMSKDLLIQFLFGKSYFNEHDMFFELSKFVKKFSKYDYLRERCQLIQETLSLWNKDTIPEEHLNKVIETFLSPVTIIPCGDKCRIVSSTSMFNDYDDFHIHIQKIVFLLYTARVPFKDWVEREV